MAKPVFISYARQSSAGHAAALHARLGDELAFLDSSDIATGERFSEAVIEALFGARVVVILAEPLYFTRWYCLLEFRVARTPFLRIAERPGSTAAEREDALNGLVIAIPPGAADPMIDRIPPLARVGNWPSLADPEAIAALVLRRLAANPPTLGERYAALGEEDDSRSMLREAMYLPPPRRLGNVPVVPALGFPESIHDEFVGRADDLWRIHDVLSAWSGIQRGAALTGALEAGGGFGKTRLAIEYVYRFGIAHFPRGVFWIDAEQDVELQHYEVVKALDPAIPELGIVRTAHQGVAGVLARTIRANAGDPPRLLFVVDNVPEPEPGAPPLPLRHWCPAAGEVPVLATSRTRLGLAQGGGVVPLPVDVLTAEAAVALLRGGIAGGALTDAEWNAIAAWVGNLPLALELLNKLVRGGGATAGELLEFTRRDHVTEALDRAMDALRPSVPAGRLRGVTEALAESYARLTPAQQEAMRMLAWLGPEPLPAALLEPFGEVFSAATRIALRSRSFVSGAEGPGGALFGRVHRVLADFVRSQSADPTAECARVFSALQQALESVAGSGDERWRQVALITPHALAFLPRYVRTLPDYALEDGIAGANDVAVALYRWGFAAAAERILGSAREAAALRLGADHPLTLMVTGHLGLCLQGKGDLNASLRTLEQAWRDKARVFGENDHRTQASLNDLAVACAQAGRFADARTHQERALAGLRATVGEEDVTTLAALNNFALLLTDLGEFERARQVQERTLEILVRLHGERDERTILVRDNLGVVYGNLGDLAAAERCHAMALEDAVREWGGMHPETLTVRANLARARANRGEISGAVEMLREVVEARTWQLGPEHPETLTSISNLAEMLSAAGAPGEARALYEGVLDIRGKVFGEAHRDTLRAMSNLASTLDDLGEHARAAELHAQVLRLRLATLGEAHPDTLLSLSLAAARLFNAGDYEAAQRHGERVLRIRKASLGEGHPETVRAMQALAKTLNVRGQYARARSLRTAVLRDARKRFGAEHEETTKAAWHLYQTLVLSGDRRAAAALLRAELRWLLERLPRTLPDAQREIRAALVELGLHRDRGEP